MSATALAFVVASSAYAGFQWTIRVLVYPQFAEVGAASFAAYEQRHQQRATLAVGPLFAGLGLTSALLVFRPDGAGLVVVRLAALLVVGLILGVTAFLAVPVHRMLSDGFEPDAHRRLLRVDAMRLVLALAAAALGIVVLLSRAG